MSSARRPEHGDAAPQAFAPVRGPEPGLDSSPGGLFALPAMGVRPPHLLPCAQCGALNGRSASACWSCEAELVAAGPPFAPSAAGGLASEPSAQAEAVSAVAPPDPEATLPAEAHRGLHLISRSGVPPSTEPAPEALAADDNFDLPVLTARIEDRLPALPRRKGRRHNGWMIMLALLSASLLAAFAALRWFGQPPVAEPVNVMSPSRAAAAPLPVIPPELPAAGGVPAAEPGQPGRVAADVPARTALPSGPAAPGDPLSAARPLAPKPREIRETVSPPPSACTSNMAALGFCNLPPAATKE